MGVCTNKREVLATDLLKKINMYKYFEYVAGADTFEFNKPDPRHLTNVIEIIGGDLSKTIMVVIVKLTRTQLIMQTYLLL